MDGLDDLRDTQLIQPALQGDLQLITRAAEERLQTWAGVWFDNEPTVYMLAAFTSDVAQHDAALRPRLRHPRPDFHLRRGGKAVIHVALRADQENVTSELAVRYGSAVELRVGAFGFRGRRAAVRGRPAGRRWRSWPSKGSR